LKVNDTTKEVRPETHTVRKVISRLSYNCAFTERIKLMQTRILAHSRVVLLFFVFAVLVLAATPVQAESATPRVLPPGSSVYGLTYGEWSARWWQWAASIPTPDNPLLESGQVDCSFAQSGNVWFLAGNIGGETERHCTVPSDRYLLFPVVNLLAWRPGDFETEAEGREILAGMLNDATLEVTVDGIPIDNLEAYRVQSPLFQFMVPEDNIFDLPEPYTRDGLSDGFWLILQPLSAGEHTVHFAGAGEAWGGFFELDVTYHLTVEQGGPVVIPTDQVVEGRTYGEWSAAWWQWALSIPTAENPLVDQTGEHCANGQSGNVWFLAGTTSGHAERSCTVPADQYFFFPVLTAVAWRPGDFETEEEGRALLATFMNEATMEVVVDGVTIEDPHSYRLQSPLFQFTVPEDNIFDIPEPYTRDGISDGFWIMLDPLPPGEHEVRFYGEGDAFGYDFVVDVTYHLTVVEEPTSITISRFEGQSRRSFASWAALGLLLCAVPLSRFRGAFRRG
jgi:hypothetical protein